MRTITLAELFILLFMTTVISFISRKGGTGKTTSAINTATTLFNGNFKTILIETDTNYTLNTLRKLDLFKYGEEMLNNSLRIVGAHESNVTDDINVLKHMESYDYIVVDSAGKTTDNATKDLCLASDIVVVPTSLSQSDLLVAYQTIQDLKPAQELNKKLRIVVLPNRIHGRTANQTILGALQKLNTEIILPFIPYKVLYSQISTIHSIKEYVPTVENIIKQKLYGPKNRHTQRAESLS
jgi:chromosome partitioning protein